MIVKSDDSSDKVCIQTDIKKILLHVIAVFITLSKYYKWFLM